VSACLCASLFFAFSASADDIAERAKKLQFSSIVLDTHADTPQRMLTGNFDLGKRDKEGHVDIPRMREGGLNAQFFSIFISGEFSGHRRYNKLSTRLISSVKTSSNIART